VNDGFATRLSAAAPDLGRGVRAAVVTLVPFYLAAALHRPELSWMALGGWLGTLADPGGSRATRARTLVAFAAAGALVVAASEALAPSAPLATAWLVLAAFAFSLLRAAGGTAGSLGTLLTVTAAIASARARTTPPLDGAAFAVGALQAMVLSSAVWPVWTHLPVRRALGVVYRELAAYVEAARALIAARSPPGSQEWTAAVREHHLRIRRAIEAARTLALEVRTRREGETRYGGNVRALLGAAEAQFPLLATLVQELEALPADERFEPAGRLALVVAHQDQVARVLSARSIRSHAPALRRRRTLPPPADGPDALAARLEAESLDATLLVHAIDEPSEDDAPVAAPGPLGAGLAALRDALSPRSVFLRHAVRTAGAALAASVVGRLASPAHAHWVTLTALVILQPDPGATMKRAGERVLGTLLGCGVALVIIETVRSPVALAALMVPLSIAGVATRPRSYRLFTFFLTPVFVLLAERHPGDWMTAAVRAGDAGLGGMVALAAGVLLFPASERARLPDALAAMLDGVAAYAQVVLGADGASRAQVAATRRASGLAIAAAESSLERLLAEPRRDAAVAADAMLLVTYTRRLGTALTSIDTLAQVGATRLAPATRAAAAEHIAEVLRQARAYVRADLAVAVAHAPPALDPDAESGIEAALARALHWAALVANVARAPVGGATGY